MNGRASVLVVVALLSACQSRPVLQQPVQNTVTPEPIIDATPASESPGDSSGEHPQASGVDANNVPPCMPEAPKPKVAAKRRPRPALSADKPTLVETHPPRLGSATPEVKPIDASVGSILGKRIQGAEGEDLGRVVDVQADANGRVRLVIIEFGGFLGVGNRRAAVDWGLLRFHPDDPEQPITLSVGAKQVLGTPEYRQASHPQALMAPEPMPEPQPIAVPAPANPAPPQNK